MPTGNPKSSPAGWWFTFGLGQAHEGHYYHIAIPDQDEAREEMTRRFDKWSMQYPSAVRRILEPTVVEIGYTWADVVKVLNNRR